MHARLADQAHVLLQGWVDQARARSLLARSTVGLAPYRSIPNFELNICNKVHDYLHAGLPVVSPLQGDVRKLLEERGVGRTHAPGDADGLLDAMASLANPAFRAEAGDRASATHRERFDAADAYRRLAEHMESMGRAADGAARGAVHD